MHFFNIILLINRRVFNINISTNNVDIMFSRGAPIFSFFNIIFLLGTTKNISPNASKTKNSLLHSNREKIKNWGVWIGLAAGGRLRFAQTGRSLYPNAVWRWGILLENRLLRFSGSGLYTRKQTPCEIREMHGVREMWLRHVKCAAAHKGIYFLSCRADARHFMARERVISRFA